MFTDGSDKAAVLDRVSTIKKLKERAMLADMRVKQTAENKTKRAEQENMMRTYLIAIKRLDKAATAYNSLIDTITAYLDEKQKDSGAAVMSAVRAAIQIVPDCDHSIELKCQDGEAWFETVDGIDVSRLNGSGFRSTLSVMMRSVALRFSPQSLQTLILDEVFSKLHAENSATLSSYLPILAQEMQIISIEQKPEVFANASHVAYSFALDGDHTVVQREDVNYD